MSHTVRTVFPSAARTTTSNVNVANPGRRGVIVTIDCTADPAAASVVFTVRGVHEGTANMYTLLASAAVNSVGTTSLTVYPSITAVANIAANAVTPSTINVLATHADGDSITYSVVATFIN